MRRGVWLFVAGFAVLVPGALWLDDGMGDVPSYLLIGLTGLVSGVWGALLWQHEAGWTLKVSGMEPVPGRVFLRRWALQVMVSALCAVAGLALLLVMLRTGTLDGWPRVRIGIAYCVIVAGLAMGPSAAALALLTRSAVAALFTAPAMVFLLGAWGYGSSLGVWAGGSVAGGWWGDNDDWMTLWSAVRAEHVIGLLWPGVMMMVVAFAAAWMANADWRPFRPGWRGWPGRAVLTAVVLLAALVWGLLIVGFHPGDAALLLRLLAGRG